MNFIVESTRPGEKVKYLTATNVRGEYTIGEYRLMAHRFPTRSEASIAIRRFTSFYNFAITPVADDG